MPKTSFQCPSDRYSGSVGVSYSAGPLAAARASSLRRGADASPLLLRQAHAPAPVGGLQQGHQVLVKQLALDDLAGQQRGGSSGEKVARGRAMEATLRKSEALAVIRLIGVAWAWHGKQAAAWPAGLIPIHAQGRRHRVCSRPLPAAALQAGGARLVHFVEGVLQNVVAVQLVHPAEKCGRAIERVFMKTGMKEEVLSWKTWHSAASGCAQRAGSRGQQQAALPCARVVPFQFPPSPGCLTSCAAARRRLVSAALPAA